MKSLWLFLVLPAVIAQRNFGEADIKNTCSCPKWSCVNTRFGFPDTPLPRNIAGESFKRMIPQEKLHDVIDKALDYCYGLRIWNYTNACPGQALLHCFVDQITQNCPECSVLKDYRCTRVLNLDSGKNTMFIQDKHYFGSNRFSRPPRRGMELAFSRECCDLSRLFNLTLVQQCGFNGIVDMPIFFRNGDPDHPQYKGENCLNYQSTTTPKAVQDNADVLKVVELNQMLPHRGSNMLENKGEVIAQRNFGEANLKNTCSCPKWSCVNTRFGFPDTPLPRNVAGESFKRMIPQEKLHDVIDKALDYCYGLRIWNYTNACPGQALLHCFVDQITQNCPECSVLKDYRCTRVLNLDSGKNTMFIQDKHYFGSNRFSRPPRRGMELAFSRECCDLSRLFNITLVQQCGFNGMVDMPIFFRNGDPDYPQYKGENCLNDLSTTTPKAVQDNADVLKVVELNQMLQHRGSNMLENKAEVIAQRNFGEADIKNTRSCPNWSCVNTIFGFPDTLPPRSVAGESFKRMIPQEKLHDVIDKALDYCYGLRIWNYTNACPGQALLHCFVDQITQNCPEYSVLKDYRCSRVLTLDSQVGGKNTMFTQHKHYFGNNGFPRPPRRDMELAFSRECCDLSRLFNITIVQQCGFNGMVDMPIFFRNGDPDHPQYNDGNFLNDQSTTTPKAVQDNADVLKVVQLNQIQPHRGSNMLEKISLDSNLDPLDCCDVEGFIQPSWRSECDFHLNWEGKQRLVIRNNTFRLITPAPVTTTTANPNAVKDLMLEPHTCKQESCLFKNLGIIDDAGNVNIKAYMNMLTNFTDAHPIWIKAASRVVTKCLTRITRQYSYNHECHINKILACTLDVLTENCPYKRGSNNTCRHDKTKRGCQISSSKYLKNRREICMLPPVIDQDHLAKCGLDTLYKVDHILVPNPPKDHWTHYQYKCEEHKPAISCIISRMGVMNKYNFMDYFKMKDKIRQFTVDQPEWSALLDIYMSTYLNMPLYHEYCSTEKRMLNVLDIMLMTCPASKRVNTPKCNKFYNDITDTPPMNNQNATRQKLYEIMKHYQHIFLPTQPYHTKFSRVIRKHSKTTKKPSYNYGLLASEYVPQVQTIRIKPAVMTRLDKPLVLAPVYLRNPELGLPKPYNNHNVLRSNIYWLHEKSEKGLAPQPMPQPKLSFPTSTTLFPPYDETDYNANIPYGDSSKMLKPE